MSPSSGGSGSDGPRRRGGRPGGRSSGGGPSSSGGRSGSSRGGSGSGGRSGGSRSSGGPRGGSRSGSDGRSGSGSGGGGPRRSGGPRSDGRSGGGGRRSGSSGGPRGRQDGSGGSGSPKSGGNKRIPPPPDRSASSGRDGADGGWEREETVVERVDDAGTKRSGSSGKRRRNSGRSKADVNGIDFPGVAPATAAKLRDRLADAAGAFEAERFTEAARLLASIDKLAPGVPEVHELSGLTEYRLGKWVRALGQLEKFAELTGSVEQHPVMADCCRALRRWNRAEELWHELGDASPAPDLIEEGRIVQAGALADRGRLDDAIRFMDRAPAVKGKPGVHHLRRWYMHADLYERAGDNARARRLFGDIVRVDPSFGDAAERASSM